MGEPLRVLLVEDSEEDGLLIARQLRLGGFDPVLERVESGAALEAALAGGPWDVVLSDYHLPAFDGLAALALCRRAEPDRPFILVSGAIGEETAVEAMKAGAHDFIHKDNLARLVPAIRRELREAEDRASRRRAEAAVQESQARLKLILDSVQAGILLLDPEDHRILEANSCALSLLGMSTDAVLNAPCERFIGPLAEGDPPLTDPAHAGCLAEYRLHREGREPLTILAQPVWAQAGARRHLLISFMDVTERKALEERLRQSQKMDAIGQLAGGIAHSFNNLLMVILGRGELVQGRLAPGDPLLPDIELMHKAARRAAEVSNQLLAFSRRDEVLLKPLLLAPFLARLEPTLRQCLRGDITLTLKPGPRNLRVKADPVQLEQVILSLLLNAREAMPQGGQLTVESSQLELKGDSAERPPQLPPGSYARLNVTDSGPGMSPEVQAHLFEPFFTTKGRSGGAGLGLFTVHSIVRNCGGTTQAVSTPGKGMTFQVLLPRLADQPTDEPPEGPRTVSRPATETILLVDDDDDVRGLLRLVLQMKGYTVLDAATPREAFLIGQGHAGHIHLLIADVTLPEMSGPDLARRLEPLHAGLKVLLISGYAENVLARQGGRLPDVSFLQKPFSGGELLYAVRNILDQPPRKA